MYHHLAHEWSTIAITLQIFLWMFSFLCLLCRSRFSVKYTCPCYWVLANLLCLHVQSDNFPLFKGVLKRFDTYITFYKHYFKVHKLLFVLKSPLKRNTKKCITLRNVELITLLLRNVIFLSTQNKIFQILNRS